MKAQKPSQRGFTLIEMLVVISIIVLLASLLFPAVSTALQKARETKCLANLKSFGVAWNSKYFAVTSSVHSHEMEAIYPWLSQMVPDHIDQSMLRCPADESRGRYGSKPEENTTFAAADSRGFPETDDNRSNPATGMHDERNPEVEFCSYMYEFNDATISWGWEGYVLGSSQGDYATPAQTDINGDGRITWGEVKVMQLAHGDTFSFGPYDPTQFPLVRCFHHYKSRPVRIQNLDDSRIETSLPVMNLAVDGSVFVSGLQWEYPRVK